jgi:hypothetical protein
MIRVDKNETFPILVSLIDESVGQLAAGQTVYYDIRDLSDAPLSPPVAGTMTESTVEPGIYRAEASIAEAGEYVIYATCSGFITNTEEIIVNPESIYDLTKQNRHYNISVEDVIRENTIATPSQTVRKVGLGQSDYTITRIKYDDDTTWSGTTTSGVIYAWYRDEDDCAPFKMSDGGL